ncbi:MAG TPA: S53 family peptidase, partial [Xanthomonadales bacterium]|nr:S53 family peptidase [Xanthomonadales bacterium]
NFRRRLIRLARTRPGLTPAQVVSLARNRPAGARRAGPPQGYVALEGSEIDPVPGARALRPVNPAQVIDVTIVLRPGGAGHSLDYVEELGAQPLADRQHLSHEEFATRFAADPADVALVKKFAAQHGLNVVKAAGPASPHLMDVRGTVGAFRRAFRVGIRRFASARGVYRGRVGPVNIPQELAGIVTAVIGLDNRPRLRPHFRVMRKLGGAWLRAAASRSFDPTALARLYNFPATATGAGETIAILEFGGGFTAKDLNQYFARLGVTPAPNVSAVSVGAGRNRPTGNANGPDAEVMLDIEVAGAIAHRSRVVVYFAPNTSRGFVRAINAAAHDQVNKPSVISISWGGPEGTWTTQDLRAMNQAFQAAGALGITVCVAAGDGGSNDGVGDGRLHADFPASSPFVIACGGTRLDAAGGAISSEVVWNDGPGGGAGGGGISEFFPVPSWQANAKVPPSGNPSHHAGRGVPDVSADADPNSGYNVRVDGTDMVIGGTSAVAPLWAGLLALYNQSLGKRVGFINPLLYANAGSFRDIVTGNNDNTHLGRGYSAGPGWDAASGIGVADGTALLTALGGAAPAAASAADPGGWLA